MKDSKSFNLLSFSAFLILIVFATIAYTSYVNIHHIKARYEIERAAAKEEMWTFIENTINENQQKAILQADYVKANIQQDITTEYGNNLTGLENDMNNIQAGSTSTFLKVVSDDIKGKYINKDSDSNDMFVIGKWIKSDAAVTPQGAIIGDPSLDCSKNGEIRTFDVEIAMHFNKSLATSGLTRVINQDTAGEPIIWEFKASVNPNHKMITAQGYSGLKEVFMTEGIEGLQTYELLNPSYLSSDKDIFETNDVDYTGNKVDNYKIIVVQGYSLYDAINVNHSQVVSNYEYKLKNLEQAYQYEAETLVLETVLICALVFVVFLSIAKLQNVLIENHS